MTDLMYPKEALVEFVDEVCGIYFRSMLLKNTGDLALQHVHDHDHVTYVGNGAVRFYVDGKFIADVPAGKAVEIKAGVPHQFRALAPNTRITCVHDVASAESLKKQNL